MSENLERAKNLHTEIKDIMLRDWDPIGIQDVREASDEYDSYVPSVYKLLISQKPIHEIFEYLWWVETEHMGLIGDRQATEAIAKKLQSLISQNGV